MTFCILYFFTYFFLQLAQKTVFLMTKLFQKQKAIFLFCVSVVSVVSSDGNSSL